MVSPSLSITTPYIIMIASLSFSRAPLLNICHRHRTIYISHFFWLIDVALINFLRWFLLHYKIKIYKKKLFTMIFLCAMSTCSNLRIIWKIISRDETLRDWGRRCSPRINKIIIIIYKLLFDQKHIFHIDKILFVRLALWKCSLHCI